MRTKWREQQAKVRVHSPVQELKHLPGQPRKTERPDFSNVACRGSKNRTAFIQSVLSKRVVSIRMEQGQNTQLRVAAVSAPEKEGVKKWPLGKAETGSDRKAGCFSYEWTGVKKETAQPKEKL